MANERIIEVSGTIKHAYPLQTLHQGRSDGQGEEEEAFGDAFSIGSGPCGLDASSVVAWELEIGTTFQTCYVYLYDKWADKVQNFQRHYRVQLKGLGLVALDRWDVGHDTEDVKRCYLVAEPQVIKRTSERLPRLVPRPQGVSIEISYEEPQRLLESDQVRYLPATTITARDVYGVTVEAPKSMVLEVPKPPKANPRGKRTLREVSGVTAASSSSYSYTNLAELIPGFANFYGVVVNMSLPKHSEGRDYYMGVYLVDESCPKRSEAIQVMVFYPSFDQMPKLLHVGDIIRFHKARITRYQDRIQGVCTSRASRYLVMRESPNGKPDLQTCSASWTFEDFDIQRFNQLTIWWKEALPKDTTLPPSCPQPPRMIGDMQFAESFVDILVRVLHIQLPDQDSAAARLVVWDGSGDSSECLDLYERLRTQRDAAFVPEKGLLMEIFVDSCWVVIEHMGFLPRLKTQWCRFRNLAVSTETGTGGKAWFELHFREVSSLVLVPESVTDVQTRLCLQGIDPQEMVYAADHEEVQPPPESEQHMEGEPALPSVTTQIPQRIADKIAVTSIQNILSGSKVPHKYHCLAHVVRVWPSDYQKLTKVQDATTQSYVYSFVLRLADSSGELDVIVHGSDAEHFFHGIPPCDLTKHTSSRALLEKRLTALCEAKDPLHWCVKAYHVASQSSESDKRPVRYRLFDTLLRTVT
ncbi:hypothetical protein Poli38472_000755 [Pythium oligandrum]|uniref:Telomeric single stranded DNA binding POT1/Cdc13 domain-containing protein n=1 Tax=Pythium oligandrum TaxID=41045 RepID=A0A8K1CDQ3_PYTOL|nr:hypothetical protein Poli38472_000755 [Pythium oligandrum]|eukprot:TMW60713.1 hypothetical protein Poli38472_000755 [Pythium oligandrum]